MKCVVGSAAWSIEGALPKRPEKPLVDVVPGLPPAIRSRSEYSVIVLLGIVEGSVIL